MRFTTCGQAPRCGECGAGRRGRHAASVTYADSFIATAHQFGHGIPWQLNRVCLNGLLIGLADRKTILDETDAKRAIIELDRVG